MQEGCGGYPVFPHRSICGSLRITVAWWNGILSHMGTGVGSHSGGLSRVAATTTSCLPCSGPPCSPPCASGLLSWPPRPTSGALHSTLWPMEEPRTLPTSCALTPGCQPLKAISSQTPNHATRQVSKSTSPKPQGLTLPYFIGNTEAIVPSSHQTCGPNPLHLPLQVDWAHSGSLCLSSLLRWAGDS